MTDRLEWFPCYPAKLLGALAGMTANEKLVYMVVLLRIYEINGPCRDSVDAIAVRAGVQRRQVAAAIDRLVEDGRLVRSEDGFHNPVADAVLAESREVRRRRQKAGSEGGKNRAETAAFSKSEKTIENQRKGPSNATAKLKPGSTPLQEQEQEEVKEKIREKKNTATPPDDGWPEDHLEQFWAAFPPYRRESKRKCGEKLARIRASKVVAWEVLIGAVRRFAATNPGEYAPAPMVWLNNERWDREFGGSNGKAQGQPAGGIGFVGIAARIRHRQAAAQSDNRSTADPELPYGR